jgi:hypothetical protein
VRITPVSPDGLRDLLVERISAMPAGWVRVAIDGAPAAAPDEWARQLVQPLRAAGRPALHVRAADFLRPASLRYEFGRTDPDSYYDGWLDLAGLRREVLEPLRPGGSGRVLPSLWNPVTDRATRAGYETVPPDGVLLLSGDLLLGSGLPIDFAVHLRLSAAALARRMPPELAWTLPAYERYEHEVDPASFADLVVRLDDPRHPALLVA